jgi:hypothetical protein
MKYSLHCVGTQAIRHLRASGKEVPPGYEDDFATAEHVFLYQRVFDTRRQTVVTLHDVIDAHEIPTDVLDRYIGEYAGGAGGSPYEEPCSTRLPALLLYRLTCPALAPTRPLPAEVAAQLAAGALHPHTMEPMEAMTAMTGGGEDGRPAPQPPLPSPSKACGC